MAHTQKRSSKGGDKKGQDRRGSGSHSSSSRNSRQEQQQYDWISTEAEQGSNGPPVDDPIRDAAQVQARREREEYARNHPGVSYPRQPSRRDTISRQMNEVDRQMGNTNSHAYQYDTNLNFDGSDTTGGDGYANSNYPYYPYQDPRRS